MNKSEFFAEININNLAHAMPAGQSPIFEEKRGIIGNEVIGVFDEKVGKLGSVG